MLGWAAAIAVNVSVLYGPHSLYTGGTREVWPNAVNVIYLSTSRFAWSMGVAWVAIACVYGYGGRYNSKVQFRYIIPALNP